MKFGTPVQGTTLYSFTRAFHARDYTLEQLIREVAQRGLGPGLEVVGFQSFKGFPSLEPATIDWFRSLVEEVDLVPTCLSANADAGIRRDRMLSDDELVDYMRPQIEAAHLLGFPVVRVQISLTPDDMERLLPVAEQYGVALGLEVHSHQHPRHPAIQALLERYEKLGSPLLGFVPDWGATLVGVPSTLLERYRLEGVNEELIKRLPQLWAEHHAQGAPMTEEAHGAWFGQVMQEAHRAGEGDRAIEMAVNITGLFGHAPAADWAQLLPWAVHTHGKFYEIDASGQEPATPVRELTQLWVEAGYSAAITAEWEGFHWNDWSNPFDEVAGVQALMRDSALHAGSEIVTDSITARDLLSSPRRSR